jgi:23S rRNA (cytidine1920-2'-O)/16S rRNA (cytidine1409-2'-O)-methyltransferase
VDGRLGAGEIGGKPTVTSRSRLDLLVTERGLAESRERAQALILAGHVLVNGQPGIKAGQQVASDARIEVLQPPPYVSRGGYKLAHALDRFQIDVAGQVALDVGASTGGFTDVLLQRGARLVYAVDVGRGQLHQRIATDPRVVVMDRVNARSLSELPQPASLATVDVSFISLRLVLPPVRRVMVDRWTMIALIKPQFEAGRQLVGPGGVIRSAAVHGAVLESFSDWLLTESLLLRGLTASPIRGSAGNIEFLAWLVPADVGATEVQGRPEDFIGAALDEAEESR